MLDVLAKTSPLHLHYQRSAANENERTPTPAQMIGTAFHALLLEPAEFVKDYCLALRPQDVPAAIESKDQLLALVAAENAKRLPKLSTSGSKADLVDRILNAQENENAPTTYKVDDLASMAAAELKDILSDLNRDRLGLLSATGTMEQLAQTLRDAGLQVTLWQDVKAEWLQHNGHRIVLTQEQWNQLHSMRDAVMAHPAACALMTACPGKAEQSVYWIDPATGELCRCRPDFWRADGIIVDLKTTDDASPEGFAKSIANWRYHVQHAMYLDGIAAALEQSGEHDAAFPDVTLAAPKAFVFLAVEKDACVVNGQAKGVAVYVLDADSVALGRAEYQRALAEYAQCRRNNVWPGYGDKIQNIALPAWMFSKAAA
jgi:exodeoxyribonuclease VIII